MNAAQHVLIYCVRLYRWFISPAKAVFFGSLGRCRFTPSCSQYADEAIERHGFWAGGWMTLARLLRCHPLGTSGLDFVAGTVPPHARWYLPWRYGRWRGVNNPPQ